MKAPPDLFRWARWQFDNGAPTHFTPEQAEENCRYFIDVLDEKWLVTGQTAGPGGRAAGRLGGRRPPAAQSPAP